MKIAFIGAGKMAEALIASLGDRKNIFASDISGERLKHLKSKYKIKTARNNSEAFAAAQVIVLAVKPQQVAEVLQGIGSRGIGSRGIGSRGIGSRGIGSRGIGSRGIGSRGIGSRGIGSREKKLIISIAAGIPLKYLQKKLPGHSVIRAMPNNPALIGQGMTALAKGKKVTNRESRVAKKMFESVGEVVEVPEKWLNAVTGLSGSGPAYVYQMIAAMTDGGVKAGLPKAVAAKLATQTVYGAAATVKKTGRDPEELRKMVTSPGGTTLEGLKALELRLFSRAVSEAVGAAAKKSGLLSKQWSI
jgi:pyrroline-5-carboxylate reductase